MGLPSRRLYIIGDRGLGEVEVLWDFSLMAAVFSLSFLKLSIYWKSLWLSVLLIVARIWSPPGTSISLRWIRTIDLFAKLFCTYGSYTLFQILHDFCNSKRCSRCKCWIWRSISTGVGKRNTCMVPALLQRMAIVKVSSDGNTRSVFALRFSRENCLLISFLKIYRLLWLREDMVTTCKGILILAAYTPRDILNSGVDWIFGSTFTVEKTMSWVACLLTITSLLPCSSNLRSAGGQFAFVPKPFRSLHLI